MKGLLGRYWGGVALLLTLMIGAAATIAAAQLKPNPGAEATVEDGLLTVRRWGLVMITCNEGLVHVNGADMDDDDRTAGKRQRQWSGHRPLGSSQHLRRQRAYHV